MQLRTSHVFQKKMRKRYEQTCGKVLHGHPPKRKSQKMQNSLRGAPQESSSSLLEERRKQSAPVENRDEASKSWQERVKTRCSAIKKMLKLHKLHKLNKC